MENLTKIGQLRHLFGRAGFGATPATLHEAARHPLRKTIRSLMLITDNLPFMPLQVVEATDFIAKRTLKGMFRAGMLDKETLKGRIRENAELVRDLNVQWLDRMATGHNALREKMALFWHGHFACRTLGQNPLLTQQYANTIRQHALGNFKELLLAVSKEPAMLQFLNNQQNRKNAPNENFAREVMELFTLGKNHAGAGQVSHYTEHDIKEAARAFTGWGFTPTGQFQFRPSLHDEGDKTIFGKTGAFKGEDVIAMLLARKETAQFITAKLYRYFVNETENPAHIGALSEQFYRSGYDIADLMETIFRADWFYDPVNVGTHIKSPVELLAGMRLQLGVTFTQPQPQIFVQRTLGQILFYPPNVAGWPGGKSWIDSSSLLFRMNLPNYVLKAADVPVRPKDEGDVNAEVLARKGSNQFNTTVNWADFTATFTDIADADLPDTLAAYLLPWPLTSQQRILVQKLLKSDQPKPEKIKTITTAIMSLPEYQLV